MAGKARCQVGCIRALCMAACVLASLLAGPQGSRAQSGLDAGFSTTELERMCRTPEHRINVQLIWDNREIADLDLHAMRPDGKHISYRARGTDKCKGVLDHDRLRGSRFNTPETFLVKQDGCRTPAGSYRIWVRYFSGRLARVPFTLKIRLGDSVEITCRGQVTRPRGGRQTQPIFLPVDPDMAEAGDLDLPSWCE